MVQAQPFSEAFSWTFVGVRALMRLLVFAPLLPPTPPTRQLLIPALLPIFFELVILIVILVILILGRVLLAVLLPGVVGTRVVAVFGEGVAPLAVHEVLRQPLLELEKELRIVHFFCFSSLSFQVSLIALVGVRVPEISEGWLIVG